MADDYSGYDLPVLNLDSDDEPDFVKPDPILVGRVISGSRCFSVRVVADIMSRAWNVSKPMKVVEMKENTFLFTFEAEAERLRVFNNSPWSINGAHLCLREWSSDVVLNSVSFESLEFWVQVYGLPPHYMRLSKAERLVGLFSGISYINLPRDNTILWADFFLMKVQIDVNKPLPMGFYTKDRVEDVAIQVDFCYEDLGDFCFFCGKIGHLKKECSSSLVDKNTGKQGCRWEGYGPHLRVSHLVGRHRGYSFRLQAEGRLGSNFTVKPGGTTGLNSSNTTGAPTGLACERVSVAPTSGDFLACFSSSSGVPPTGGIGQLAKDTSEGCSNSKVQMGSLKLTKAQTSGPAGRVYSPRKRKVAQESSASKKHKGLDRGPSLSK
ncbi:hypothetical protein Tsubulata_021855 [Turnera subulata]|uniref:CCHC-type domain-containing protein n=1 Tax=Turnera subulata TaxID=218843 RepID=A0A9Q0JC09_9ROSI|nr:hypothetical protein Tsubulata_021855 [Turnera subulata]